MDIPVIIALVVASGVCLLPGIMAWSFYFGGTRKSYRKKTNLREMKPVTHEAY